MTTQVLVRGVPHPETVATGPDGALYAGTAVGGYQEQGPLARIDLATGDVRPFVDTQGRILGIASSPAGELVCCDVLRSSLLWLDMDGRIRRIVRKASGIPLSRPNGCTVAMDGGVWFTDSGTARAGEPTGAICYAPPFGEAVVVSSGLVFPNGIGLSPDGARLYTTLTSDDTLLCHDVLGPGELGPAQVLNSELHSRPDGLSVAPEGELLVAVTRTSRVVAVSPDGEARVLVEDPQLLHMPSHAAVDGHRVLVPCLFGDTIVAVDRRANVKEAGTR